MGTPARSLESIEKSIRANNLRGADVAGLEQAAREERALFAPNQVFALHERLERIEVEIKAAAAAGDVEEIRRLMVERESVRAEEARRDEEALQPFRRRMAGQPAEGEEADLEKRLKKLDALTTRKQTKLAKLRAQLIEQPEDVDLHARIEDAEADLSEVQPQIDAIVARQAQIAEYHAWIAQREDIDKRQAETKAAKKEREKEEKALTFLADKMTKDFLTLRETAGQFQEIVARRMTKANLRLHYDVLDSLRWKMGKATNNGILRDEGIDGALTITARVASPEVK